MTYVAPLPIWILGCLILICNGTALSLAFYLKRHHPNVWESFGGEWVATPDGSMQFSHRFARTGYYALFQSKYRALADEHVSLLVLVIRLSFLATIALLVVLKWWWP